VPPTICIGNWNKNCQENSTFVEFGIMAESGGEKTNGQEFFNPIDADDIGLEVKEIESYCVNCEENGTTKLLLTQIPFYKEVIIASFSCPFCHFVNNEIQPAGDIPEKGIEIRLEAKGKIDLNRQVISSDYSSILIPELELEIGENTRKGQITTVEGILERLIRGLEQDQPRRELLNPEEYTQIQGFINKVLPYKAGDLPFTLIVRDISGNSFIGPRENFLPTEKDAELRTTHFERKDEEDHLLGIFSKLELADTSADADKAGESEALNIEDEVHEFLTNCPDCKSICSTKMKVTKIPYFKEVIIMASDCDACGNRTNEVKSGSGIEEKGRKITLTVENADDMSRDILKSETCSLEIPSLELEVSGGTFGGKFTTLEGLLRDIRKQLVENNPLISGDSSDMGIKQKMKCFGEKFDKLLALEAPFKLIMDDPAGNSYLQNVYAPDDDPQMEIVEYERTFDQNEELGLNDMKTEGYETLEEADETR